MTRTHSSTKQAPKPKRNLAADRLLCSGSLTLTTRIKTLCLLLHRISSLECGSRVCPSLGEEHDRSRLTSRGYYCTHHLRLSHIHGLHRWNGHDLPSLPMPVWKPIRETCSIVWYPHLTRYTTYSSKAHAYCNQHHPSARSSNNHTRTKRSLPNHLCFYCMYVQNHRLTANYFTVNVHCTIWELNSLWIKQ